MVYRVICSHDSCGWEAFLSEKDDVEVFVNKHEHPVGVDELGTK